MTNIIHQKIISCKSKFSGTRKRFLGIDYGEAKIGLALSDDSRLIASPLEIIPTHSAAAKIKEVIEIRDVGALVFGLPLNMRGEEEDMAAKVREFAKNFPDIDALFIDERLTSIQSEKSMIREMDMSRKKRRETLDAIAAAHILQGVLDTI